MAGFIERILATRYRVKEIKNKIFDTDKKINKLDVELKKINRQFESDFKELNIQLTTELSHQLTAELKTNSTLQNLITNTTCSTQLLESIERTIEPLSPHSYTDAQYMIRAYKRNFEYQMSYGGINFPSDHIKLISNLDQISIDTVNTILARHKRFMESDGIADIEISHDELLKLQDLRINFKQNILQLAPNCFNYGKYYLPINHFEASVFYYQHGMHLLKTRDRLKNKDIIDAGAFIGDSALIFSELTDRKVYSFEPTQNNYNLMLKTIELNTLQNVEPQHIALGSKEEETLYMKLWGGASHVATEQQDGLETVKSTTLDKFVEDHHLDVGLIKVDIEGFEQQFLKGAQKTIKTNRPILLLSIYHNMPDFFHIQPIIESWNLGYTFQIYKPLDGQIMGETLLIAEVP